MSQINTEVQKKYRERQLLKQNIIFFIKIDINIYYLLFIIMPQTNAEIQKKFRERQLLYNREEYLQKKRDNYKKYYRKKFKDDIDPEIKSEEEQEQEQEIKEEEQEFIILKPIKKRQAPLNKTIIKDETKKIYIKSLSKIYNSYYHKEITDEFKEELIKLLSVQKYNINLIKAEFKIIDKDIYDIIKNTSKKSDIRNLHAIITRIRGFSNLVKKIAPYTDDNQLQYAIARNNKEFTDFIKQKYNALSFKKEDIIKNLNNDDLELTSKEKLLYGLFTLFHTRRPVDYKRMFIATEKPKYEIRKKINDRNNYYYDGVFYFYITKNKQIQKYDVPSELQLLIENEMKSRNDEENKKYLLLNNHNKHYKYSSDLSRDIMLVFKKIYKLSISAVEIRKLYCTYLKYQVENGYMIEQEHRKIAEMMNHSYEENLKYAYNIK
jgi:hypothetical protein